jgi:hypothetical protein
MAEEKKEHTAHSVASKIAKALLKKTPAPKKQQRKRHKRA